MDSCVEHTQKKTYANVMVHGQHVRLHRLICAETHGVDLWSPSWEARHLCGNGRCINPRHLSPGTPQENAADRDLHGTTATGERNGNAKLTADDVHAIRAMIAAGLTNAAIADVFSVTPENVSSIKRRRTWADVG